MSTSGAFSFTISTYKIIELAVKYLGKLGENDELTPSEYDDCKSFLNMMIKQWIVRNDSSNGMKTWLRHTGYLFLNSNSGTYNLSTSNTSYWTENFYKTTSAGSNAVGANTINVANASGMLSGDTIGIQCDDGSLFWSNVVSITANAVQIYSPTGLITASENIGNVVYDFKTHAQPPQIVETVVLRDSLGNDTPIANLNQEDYENLPSKQAPGYFGDPLAIYVEPHLVTVGTTSYVQIQTDVAGAQDVSKYLVFKYLQEIQDFNNLTDEPDFPKEWQMALVLNLAKHVAPMFNATWSQEQESQAANALIYARNARAKTSTRGFIPGIRSEQDTITIRWR